MASWTKTSTSTKSSSTSRQHTDSRSTTKKVLDSALLDTIMSGLAQPMSGEEIEAYARSLLLPQLNAALEAAQQQYETTELAARQEIENLAVQLAASIGAQQDAYRRSMADVETAALSRGMGRSSYTLETLAAQGDALADAVLGLTQENERRSAQLQAQISQAARQSAATQGRLQSDFAAQLAAKREELEREQRREHDSHYLTAVSAAMGSQTTGTSDTQGESHSSSSSSRTTTSGRTSSGSSGTKKNQAYQVDAVSMAAPTVRQYFGL